jgi:hypothetical protein
MPEAARAIDVLCVKISQQIEAASRRHHAHEVQMMIWLGWQLTKATARVVVPLTGILLALYVVSLV